MTRCLEITAPTNTGDLYDRLAPVDNKREWEIG
jgi:hypothetical protein